MKNPTPTHWLCAFSGAMLCHAVLAMAWFQSEPAKIERSAGAPIEIVGSLANFAKTQTAVEETVEEIAEPVEEIEEVRELTETPLKEIEPQELKPKKITEVEEAIIPKAAPKQKKPKKKVKKKKAPKKKVKVAKKKQKKRLAGKKLAALKKGGGAKGRQSKIAGKAALSNYRGRVQSHLARYKRRLGGGQKGKAVVSFSLSRSGRVTSVRLVRSSGNKAVDKATLAMVRRASPFPPIPRGGPGSMRFSVPVRYN